MSLHELRGRHRVEAGGRSVKLAKGARWEALKYVAFQLLVLIRYDCMVNADGGNTLPDDWTSRYVCFPS